MEPRQAPPEDDVNRGHVLAIPSLLTTVIATILTILRVYIRSSVVKKLGWDDFCNVLGTIFMIIASGLVTAATTRGVGRHIFFLVDDLDRVTYGLLLLRVAEFLVIVSTVFMKISIALFLIFLFNTRRKTRIFLWIWIIFNTIVSLFDAAIIFPSCHPVERNWDHRVKGTCWSETSINAIGILQGVVAFCTDMVLSTLPIIFLWSIKIRLGTKIGVCVLMGIGYTSGGLAIARTVLVPTLFSEDITWTVVNLFLFGILEANFGIIACALPTIRPFFTKKRATHTTVDSSSRQYKLSALSSSTRRPGWLLVDEEGPITHASSNPDSSLPDQGKQRVGSEHESEEGLVRSPTRILRTTDIAVQHEIAPTTGV